VILRIVRQLCSLIRFSNLQQELIKAISQTNLNTTQFASRFSFENNVPKSTVWFNLRKLRDSGLIKFNSKITLTKLGKILSCDSSIGRAIGCNPMCAGSSPARGTCRKARGKKDV
jgi:hypothetical protein